MVDALRISGTKPGRWGAKSVVVDVGFEGKGEGTREGSRSVSMK